MFMFYIERGIYRASRIRCYHFYTLLARANRIHKFLCVSILMLFFAIKRMNTKIGEAIFILHVQVLFEYQMEKRIKKLCYFN